MFNSIESSRAHHDLISRELDHYASPNSPILSISHILTLSAVRGILQMVNGEKAMQVYEEIRFCSAGYDLKYYSGSSYWMLETLKNFEKLYPKTPLEFVDQIDLTVRLHLDKALESKIRTENYSLTATLNYNYFFLLAAKIGNYAAFRLAVDYGANDSLKVGKDSALDLACHHGYTEIASFILQRRAALHLNNNSDLNKPFMKAIQGRHQEIVKLLIQEGVEIDPELDIDTAYSYLFFPVSEGHYELVELLLQWGVKPHHFETAMLGGHHRIAELLRRHILLSQSKMETT